MIPFGGASRTKSLLTPFPWLFHFCLRSSKLGSLETKNPSLARRIYLLRRERDSNPRYVAVNTLSKRARSATLPPLQCLDFEGSECIENMMTICRQQRLGRSPVRDAYIHRHVRFGQAACTEFRGSIRPVHYQDQAHML
jgi:hypothetical protein